MVDWEEDGVRAVEGVEVGGRAGEGGGEEGEGGGQEQQPNNEAEE